MNDPTPAQHAALAAYPRADRPLIDPALLRAQDTFLSTYLDCPGVCGAGIGVDCIRIYLESEGVLPEVQGIFMGVRVERVVTGEIIAL